MTPSWGSLRRAAAALAVGLAAAGGMVGTWVPGHDGRVAGAQAAGSTSLQLTSQTTWVRTGEAFEAVVRITPPATDGLELQSRVYGAVSSRSQFALTLDGSNLGRVVAAGPTLDLADPTVITQGSVTVRFEGASMSQGVHPVLVQLRNKADRQVVAELVTYLVRVPDEVGPQPLRVAWVQPLTAPPALQPDGTRELDVESAAAVNRILGALAEQPGLPLTVDLTPETAQALVAADPQAATRLAAALSPPTARLLAAPFVDIDTSDLVGHGLAGQIVAQRRAGETVLAAVTQSSGDPRLWSSNQTLSPQAVGELLTMGVTGVVVPEDGLEPLDPRVLSRRTLVQPFGLADGEGRVVDAVAADPQLLAHLEVDDPVLGGHRLLAELAYLYFDAPTAPKGVVLRPPSGWTAPRPFLDVLVAGLATSSVVDPVGLETLFASVPPLQDGGRRVIREAAPSPPSERARAATPISAEIARRIRSAESELALARSLAGSGEDTPALAALEPHLLVAQAASLPNARRLAHLAAVTDVAVGAVSGVRLGDARSFRLTAREGTIPITLANDNPFAVTVRLELASDKLEFPEAGSPRARRQVFEGLVIEPQQRLVVTVPVRTLSSAAFPLRASVRPDSGTVELASQSYTVISTAVPGVGIALSVGAGVGLAWWWGRHWRRSRRLRVAAAEADPGPGPDDPAR